MRVATGYTSLCPSLRKGTVANEVGAVGQYTFFSFVLLGFIWSYLTL